VEQAGEDKPTLSRLNNVTGCVLDEQKRYAEALPYFEKAALIEPEDGMYLANIAELHYKLGQAKEAIRFVRQAKEKKFESDLMSEILKNEGIMK
jgi:tetratricopeptide (TPR) repeat protein